MRVLVFVLLAVAVLAGARRNALVEAAQARPRPARVLPANVAVLTRVPLPQTFRFQRDGDVQAAMPSGPIVGAYADPATGIVHLGPENRGHKYDRTDEFTAAHELAHLLDFGSLDDAWRRRFQRTMGMPAGEWRRGTGMTREGLRSPSEWFGDYYAAAAIRMRPGEGVGSYATITPRRLRRFERALTQFAGTQPLLRPYRERRILAMLRDA
jgi:hypothetical protein